MYTILLIDDNRMFRTLLAEVPDGAIPELRIYQAADMLSAIDILEKEEVDLMLVRAGMATETAYGLLSDKMRELNRWPEVVFLLPEKEITHLSQLQGLIRKSPEMEQKLPEKRKDTIMLSTAIGVCPVVIGSILAIERTQRNFLNVYTVKRTLKEVRGTLVEISKPLPDDFVFINRQCIINRTAITRIIPKTREVFLDTEFNEITFSCSRDKIRDIIAWFDSFKYTG